MKQRTFLNLVFHPKITRLNGGSAEKRQAGRQAAKIGRCRPLGGMVAAAELCQARLYEWGGRFPIAFCVGQRGEMACESEACDAGRRSEKDGRGRLNGRKKEGVKLGHV